MAPPLKVPLPGQVGSTVKSIQCQSIIYTTQGQFLTVSIDPPIVNISGYISAKSGTITSLGVLVEFNGTPAKKILIPWSNISNVILE